MRKNKNNKLSEVNRQHILSTLRIVMVAVTLLSACGDFRDQPETPIHENPQPHVDPPKTPETPKTQEKPHNPSIEKMNEMCEAERQWTLSAGLIDLNQLRLFQRRNFAPVFNTPGERQSGIDGWVACLKALEINGFVTLSRNEPESPRLPAPQPPVDPIPAVPRPAPIQPPPIPEKPQPSSVQRMNEMCEAERQWALSAGLIDINQFRLFQGRNFAPVFNTPGERQSGIESWLFCQKALQINGFIRN